jgi:hypothetical protein
VGTYLAVAAVDQLDQAQAALEHHLVTGLDGRCVAAGISNPAGSAGGWRRCLRGTGGCQCGGRG